MKNLIFYLSVLLTILASCSGKESSGSSDKMNNGTTGVSGSTARFTIAGNYLYTVDNQSLNIFNITDPAIPSKVKDINLGFGIETIFARGNTLFLGTQTGMYIYDISNPVDVQQKSRYNHIYSCDPVVADNKYAYVTLSTTNRCGRGVNELDIIDIQNLSSPYLISSFPMTNPQGLGVDGTTLFLCDDGLKIYDIQNKSNIVLKKHYNIAATDVIPLGNSLLVIGADGLYQYHYSSDTIYLLSTIYTVQK